MTVISSRRTENHGRLGKEQGCVALTYIKAWTDKERSTYSDVMQDTYVEICTSPLSSKHSNLPSWTACTLFPARALSQLPRQQSRCAHLGLSLPTLTRSSQNTTSPPARFSSRTYADPPTTCSKTSRFAYTFWRRSVSTFSLPTWAPRAVIQVCTHPSADPPSHCLT